MRIEPADTRKRSTEILARLDKLQAQANSLLSMVRGVRDALLGPSAEAPQASAPEAKSGCFFDEVLLRTNEVAEAQSIAIKELERVATEI